MDLDEQIKLGHLLLEERRCRVCGIYKNLLNGYYRVRKNMKLASSYSYECKECAKKRVLENYYDTERGTCNICNTVDVKIVNDVCKNCKKALNILGNDLDTLEKAVLYLKKISEDK